MMKSSVKYLEVNYYFIRTLLQFHFGNNVSKKSNYVRSKSDDDDENSDETLDKTLFIKQVN